MAGRIPDSFIEELLSRTDIVEVIERRVQLRKAGNEYHALCPFHDEKSPSFTVSPTKQFYHCFGCGAHGSAVGFLMQFEGLEFRDAIEDLAHMAGLAIPESVGPQRAERPRAGLYELMEEAAVFYQEQLKKHPPAVEYLKQRGLSGEVCRDFAIGYAPAAWDELHNTLGSDAERLALLQRAGMLSQGKQKSYDKFRDRIMFPIHDRRGRVIAFGGRAIADDGPKYLNSPETELFHKGRELYGLYLARKRSGRLDSIIVVEGYMDVVALAQFGIHNCVATLGTATTSEQAGLLLRASDTVVYCFDGDKAGRTAAWKALLATLPKLAGGKQARFLFLPDGEDPDSMVRKLGEAEFRALLDAAQPLSDFFFDHLSSGLDMESIDGRSKLVQLAQPHLDTLPEGVFRDMMAERLELLARHRLRQDPALAGRPSGRAYLPRPAPSSGQAGARGAPQRTPMRLALALLVQNPSFAELAGDLSALDGLDWPGLDLLLELVDFCRERPNLTTAQLLEVLREHSAHAHLAKLAVWQLPGEADSSGLEFQDVITGLQLKKAQDALNAMPRIVDQSAAQREQFRALQFQVLELKGNLRGRNESN
jgi:DNA primase